MVIISTGRGGYGGRGGSSYSWTETHYSYTDSRGYAHYTTTSHFNPGMSRKACLIQNLLSYSIHFFFILGGSSGPSGSPGRRPTHPLYNGISGIDGIFRFLIEDR